MEDLKAKRELVNPILVKMGVAVGLTFAGFVYSHFRQRRIRLPVTPPPRTPERRRAGIKGEARLMLPSPAAAEEEETPQTPQKVMEDTAIELSAATTKSSDADGFLQKDFESAGFSPTAREMESALPKRSDEEVRGMEQEINNLRNAVRVLREREQNLEIQLLEYCGLKEQSAAVRELQNRLKISSMEAQLFTIKIESLQAENRRLDERVGDYSRVVSELDLARAKIKQMKRKIRADSDQAKEHLSALHLKVAALKEHELKLSRNDTDNKKKVERVKELEAELAELRKANSRLENENSQLCMKLESAQHVISSTINSPQKPAPDEVQQLRKTNEELEKEVERLRTDRCADVEELVYLRWVNACLRHELKDYQPPPGKTVARDLSSSLSPRSEAKAKELILEYANSGTDERENHHSLRDFDLDCCSSSQASSGTAPDDLSVGHSGSRKFFNKLKQMISRKDGRNHSQRALTSDKTRSMSDMRASASVTSLDDMLRTSSAGSISSCITVEPAGSISSCITVEPAGSNRPSPDPHTFHDPSISKRLQQQYRNNASLSSDFPMLRKLSLEEMKEMNHDEERLSDEVSFPPAYKRMVLGKSSEKMEYRHQDYHQPDGRSSKQQELVAKFAQALKDSRSNSRTQQRSRRPSAHF